MPRVKVCGITNLEDALAAAKFGADALGFVFTKSPRRISPARATEVIRSLPPFIASVGVFVNESPEVVRRIAEECRLTTLQFHGEESADYCLRFNMKVIKAFRIRDEGNLKVIPDYQVDAYLLDTYMEGIPGGTGESFNWDLAVEVKELNRPVILAGGLTPDNIAEAVGKVNPYGVDVSSGIEAEPGKKDHELMKEFIKKVRS